MFELALLGGWSTVMDAAAKTAGNRAYVFFYVYVQKRADVARMRQTRLSSPDQGGDFSGFSLFARSHCVLLSALTYALSPIPPTLITHHL